MADLSTRYMGISLRNPLIIGSSGLSDSVEKIKNLEKNGAGAIVLRSIFEEEIVKEYEEIFQAMDSFQSNLEYLDYYDYKIKEKNIEQYLTLIRNAKKEVNIPIFASINCLSAQEWTFFARKLQEAGADGIELNIFSHPADTSRSSDEIEKEYFEIIEKVLSEVNIPVALKVGYHFSNLENILQKFSKTGIQGLILFNRYFNPDFDIDHLRVIPSYILSSPSELYLSLRWVEIMSDRIDCSIAASTGIHNGEAVVKQLLAGADAVQIVSTVYKNGVSCLETMLKYLEKWMQKHNYHSIEQFKGKMCQSKSDNPALYERVQFLRYFKEYKH